MEHYLELIKGSKRALDVAAGGTIEIPRFREISSKWLLNCIKTDDESLKYIPKSWLLP